MTRLRVFIKELDMQSCPGLLKSAFSAGCTCPKNNASYSRLSYTYIYICIYTYICFPPRDLPFLNAFFYPESLPI